MSVLLCHRFLVEVLFGRSAQAGSCALSTSFVASRDEITRAGSSPELEMHHGAVFLG